jgi:hypothetical protein
MGEPGQKIILEALKAKRDNTEEVACNLEA